MKIGVLLGRHGVSVLYRTLHRFCVECCDFAGRKQATTVRVADGAPGVGCQLDFGELGLLAGPVTGRRGKVHAAEGEEPAAGVVDAVRHARVPHVQGAPRLPYRDRPGALLDPT